MYSQCDDMADTSATNKRWRRVGVYIVAHVRVPACTEYVIRWDTLCHSKLQWIVNKIYVILIDCTFIKLLRCKKDFFFGQDILGIFFKPFYGSDSSIYFYLCDFRDYSHIFLVYPTPNFTFVASSRRLFYTTGAPYTFCLRDQSQLSIFKVYRRFCRRPLYLLCSESS